MYATLLKKTRDFVALWPQLYSLRHSCGVADDVTLDPLHFLASACDAWRPSAVAGWREGHLIGVLFAAERFYLGVRTGHAVAGNFTGRGLLVCKPEDEEELVQTSVSCLFADGIHSLEMRHVTFPTADYRVSDIMIKRFQAVIPGDQIPLAASYEEFLQTLGKHTRRNIRNFTRKAVEEGIRYDATIQPEEFLKQRQRLNGITRFPADQLHLQRDARLLILHGASLFMGLRAADASLVALLCGFRRGRRFHLLTQWNDPALDRLSLGLVLRGYMVEELIQMGCDQLLFMGGTTPAWNQFCQPQPFQLMLFERSSGIPAAVKRLLAHHAAGRAARGKPVSWKLERLIGGYSSTDRIIARSSLKQAISFSLPTQLTTLDHEPASHR